jgi:lysophospholipase L1-like esterase
MIECLILGDSIAVGTQYFRPNCGVYAKSGINSAQWNINYRMMELNADTVVISLGSNDAGIDTEKELTKLRSRVKAKKVYWIVPAIKPKVQRIVEQIAYKNKDRIVKIPSLSRDGIHPTYRGYQKIGDITK